MAPPAEASTQCGMEEPAETSAPSRRGKGKERERDGERERETEQERERQIDIKRERDKERKRTDRQRERESVRDRGDEQTVSLKQQGPSHSLTSTMASPEALAAFPFVVRERGVESGTFAGTCRAARLAFRRWWLTLAR